MHFRDKLSLLPDETIPITDTIRDDFATKLDTFWGAVKSHVSSYVTLVQYRMYDMPSTPGDLGPPKKVYSKSLAGTSSTQVTPPQNSISVTWKTDQRKQWGRFYMPGLVSGSLDPTGRLSTSAAAAIALAAKPLASRTGTGGTLTVWSPTHWERHDPQTVQVDDVTDVIRRRRFSATHYRATQVLGS